MSIHIVAKAFALSLSAHGTSQQNEADHTTAVQKHHTYHFGRRAHNHRGQSLTKENNRSINTLYLNSYKRDGLAAQSGIFPYSKTPSNKRN
jgi:hypothetical protein